jgi:hypothetical protein
MSRKQPRSWHRAVPEGEVVTIKIVGINYLPELTGLAPYPKGMAEGLAAYGHNVNVVTEPHRWRILRFAAEESCW